MSIYDCPTCKKYMLFPKSHRCAPQWLIWNEGATEEDGRIVFSDDMSYAVQEFCEADDCRSAEYPEERIVFAKKIGADSAPSKFTVFLESEPVYTARLIQPKTEEPK